MKCTPLIICLMAAPEAVHAQSTEFFRPSSLAAWSLGATHDESDSGTTLRSDVFRPLFMFEGNPAGVMRGITTTSALLSLSHVLSYGDYRRPLDPGRVRQTQVGAYGQAAFSSNAVIGRAEVGQGRTSDAHLSVLSAPYSYAPYAIADTSSADSQFSSMLAEGSAGVRLGRVVIGAGARVSAETRNTVSAPTPRNGRGVHPAAVGGLEFRVADGVRLSAHALHEFWSETAHTRAVAAETRIFEFNGLIDVQGRDLRTFHNRERKGVATRAAVGLNGEWKDLSWIASYARQTGGETHRSSSFGDPLFDWERTRNSVIAGIGAALPRPQVETQLTAEYRSDRECGTRTEAGDRCTLHGARTTLDVQWWTRARLRQQTQSMFVVAVTRADYELNDDLVPARYGNAAITTRFAASIHHHLSRGVGVLATAGHVTYGASGQLPRPTPGTAFAQYTAPALLVGATDANTLQLGAGLSFRRGEAVYVLSLEARRLAPRLDGVYISTVPEGKRQQLHAQLSVIF